MYTFVLYSKAEQSVFDGNNFPTKKGTLHLSSPNEQNIASEREYQDYYFSLNTRKVDEDFTINAKQ